MQWLSGRWYRLALGTLQMGSHDSSCKRHLKKLVYSLGKLYAIRPKNIMEGTELCRKLQGYNLPTTLGKLSKFGDDPSQIVCEYQLASNAVAEGVAGGRFYLSIKPPALNFNPEYAAAIALTALKNGHGIHLDSHEFAEVDPTLRLLEDLLERDLPAKDANRNWRYSLTLPSRWKRSMADARWAAKKGVRVRVVKGDFKAAASDETDPEAGFLALVDQLAGSVPDLALATHDCALAREAIASCQKAGSAVQLELFFGMPAGAMLSLTRKAGVPIGFYVPYGDTLLIYVIRDLLTNPHKLLRSDCFELLGGQETKLARIVGAL
jgi:proline dehydrogenase